jgi:diguanylate cyclase (GGDEF)-like protein
MSNHSVQFYDSNAFLVKTVFEFCAPTWLGDEGVIVIATRDHLESLQTMRDASLGGMPRDGADSVVFLDARETLATFMVDGLPDEQRFTAVVGGLMRRVSRNSTRHVRAFGEMVAVLYAEGNRNAAVRLEQLWEQLAQHHPFSLLCAYPLSAFPDDGHRHAFQCICEAHSQVNPLERVGATHQPDKLHRTIALLQQRANALESELRRRREIERVLKTQNARIAAMASAQAELEHLAGEDALTGLSNRRIFTDRLTHAVERATRAGNPLALIFIDLDNFKALNDSHGHAAGDYLLKQVAARLSLCVRTVDTVCRWGGDEFAIIAEDADAEQAGVLMQRIVLALGETFVLGDRLIDVSASVGVVHQCLRVGCVVGE